MTQPNILYLHSHDTGRYVQPYGHAIPTPNLQRLAEQGVLFRQNFCANPTCSPSRACLLTGQYAHSNGMIGLAHRGFSMPDYTRHILHTLRKAGYVSALSGVQHIAQTPSRKLTTERTREPSCGDKSPSAATSAGTAKFFDPPWEKIGYDRFLGAPKEAHERAAELLANAPSQPFFLSVGFFETHRKFPPPGPTENPDHCIPPAPLPDTPETREDMAAFKTTARILDKKMGVVLDALDANGLAENTLVICTTDHGIAFPRMKCNLTDGGIGVMLIMRGPGGFTGGRVVNSLVSHVDLFPTVCDLIGVEPPDWLQGVSLMPLVRGEAEDVRDEIFAEVNYHAAYEPMRCVRTKRWKYIRRFDGRAKPVLPNCDDSPSKTVWLESGWADVPPPEEALYDVILDPNEMNNLVDEPRAEEALADMRARLNRWMRETRRPPASRTDTGSGRRQSERPGRPLAQR